MGFNPFSIKQLANDIAGLLDALKIQKTSVLGYSLGGHIAQQFAIEYPDRLMVLYLLLQRMAEKTVYLSHLR